MIDLTNNDLNNINVTPEEAQVLNNLIQKYYEILNTLPEKQKMLAPFIAYIIEISVEHLKTKYSEFPAEWKALSIIFVKQLYVNNQIKDNDIVKYIDDFILHYNKNYQEFINTLGMSASDYDRDYLFLTRYLNEKIGN